MDNLFAAWRKFMKGKRGKRDAQGYALRIEDRLFALHDLLKSGRWKHGGYHEFFINDPKPRKIHKASVADRIVHHAVIKQIEPLFDSSFIFDSWSCRKGKGTHHAVVRCHRKLRAFSQKYRKTIWVLKCDIKKFFQNVNHDILVSLLEKKIVDNRARGLLNEIIGSFHPGLPLGNLTSQLFANIYLNGFDHYITECLRPRFYLRYADDFLLIHEDRQWLEAARKTIANYLSSRLKLQLHPNKISLRPFRRGIDWLGYVLYPEYCVLRPSTRKRMLRRIDDGVENYLNSDNGYGRIRSITTSYQGLVQLCCNREDLKRMWQIVICLSV